MHACNDNYKSTCVLKLQHGHFVVSNGKKTMIGNDNKVNVYMEQKKYYSLYKIVFI